MFVVCVREGTERHEAERLTAAAHGVFEMLTPIALLAAVLDDRTSYRIGQRAHCLLAQRVGRRGLGLLKYCGSTATLPDLTHA
jgi:hypothetical protein